MLDKTLLALALILTSPAPVMGQSDTLTNDNPQTRISLCTSDCWQSWNVSKRAIGRGYSAAYWLPSGSDGWLEAGGELTPVQPVNFFDDSTQPPPRKQAAAPSPAPVPEESVFPKTARIFLIDQQGTERAVGDVVFSNTEPQTAAFKVELNNEQFVDQFLSMRPFKCITDPAEWFCYLPYPYELKQTVTENDLTALEYQLLFIWKSPASFGIDAWNGVYYRLHRQQDGSFKGELLQGDLNVLASPPEPNSQPINLDDFIADDAQSRLFPSLIIRP